VLEVFRKFGSIQVDPIAVAGRSHDLVLQARVAGYEPAWCDVLYERREIFEVTNRALSLIPTGEFPWFRLGIGRKGPRFHAAVLAANAASRDRACPPYPWGVGAESETPSSGPRGRGGGAVAVRAMPWLDSLVRFRVAPCRRYP
jgi:hypothetical protein